MRNNASLLYNACLVIGDFLALVVAFVVAYILRVTLSHRALSALVPAHTYLGIFLTLLPFWILIFALLGLYNARIHEQRFSELGRLFVGSFIGILFVIGYSYLTNTPIFPGRLVTVYGFGLAFFLVLLFRTVARGIRRELFGYGIGINNVLLVGDTRVTHELLESLTNTSVTGYRVLGVVGGVKHPPKANADHKVYKSFVEAVGRLRRPLHTIIQTELYADPAKNDEVLTYAQEHHVAYRFVPGNSELFVGNIQVDLFHSIPVIAVHQTALIGWGRVVKRLSDIFLGGALLIIASPFMLLLALIIKLSDGGPVFFRQPRLTRFNTKVNIFKFRSNKMAYNGLPPEEAFTKMGRPELIKEYRQNADFIPNDPRVTRIGHLMRNTKLDELPQLFNVVRGDISLVGPRALVAYELEHFPKKNLILSVKSGLTGLAQISGRRDISFEERRKLDLYYVQNWSFWNDLVILVKTIWIVLLRKGTR
ncbi:MAG TPA: sugar transferase [Candidatus Saccharimonadales bacterium]|nr:sugar transferase [Candidatus Saccharimonadales bacterium]